MPTLRTVDLVKSFRVYARPMDRVRDALSFGRRRRYTEFQALKGISLDIPGGETVGLIGQNGSGKSTLLKILARLMIPTSGMVEVTGRTASIIELGTGFHPEFTGRANVYMAAGLMGFTREETDEIFPRILDFSELHAFIDRPVKTYSSGMWVRLAFSTAISIEPQILLIDEALSVGDLLFQKKCISALKRFQEAGVTIVFVSHDLSAIKNLCTRTVLLDRGEKVSEGPAAAIVSEYVSLIASRASREKLITRSSNEQRRYGSYEAEIEDVQLTDGDGRPTRALSCGDLLVVVVRVRIHRPVESPSVGILIRDRLGNDIYGTNTCLAGVPWNGKPGRWEIQVRIPVDLGPRPYYLAVAVHSGRDHLGICYDWIDDAATFQVLPGEHGQFTGFARLRPDFSIREVEA
ncbi:MAG: ABC transporter ATP-binding protein [Acidobacteriota bacterium]